jgi:hypothetical protein
VSRINRAVAFAMILFGLMATRAQAGVVVSLSNVNMAAGGIGTMDVSVTSTGAATLSSFGLGLVITPVGTPSSIPYFLPSAVQPIAFYDSTNYVFYQQSFKSDPVFGGPSPFWYDPSASPPPNSYPAGEITGGDRADSTGPGYVTLGSGDTYLLAQVQFSVPVGAIPGDQFQISLMSNTGLTYFNDQNGNPLTIQSAGGGLVTIAGAAVPEPSSSTMLVIAGIGGLLWFCRRRGQVGAVK